MSSTHPLEVKWSVESDNCAQLITSVDVHVVHVYQDSSDFILAAYTIPINCFKNDERNSFSAALSSICYDVKCNDILWRPLDMCRNYNLELHPEYSSQLKGKSLSTEIFTSGKGSSINLSN